ncbi:MAG: TonB family protein [Candidatus Acidiferrales bacterium]
MREEKHLPEKFVPLSHCLMESDAETARLARRTRRRSMLLSTAIEAALLTAAVLIPFFASQAIPRVFNQTPIPAPLGVTPRETRPPDPSKSASGPRLRWSGTVPPITVPTFIAPADRLSSASSETPEGMGLPVGVPGGDPNIPAGLFDPTRSAPPLAPLRPAETPRAPRRISIVDHARLIHRVEPVYPALARQTRTEGTVEVRAVIATDGSMKYVEVLSGHPFFVEATKQAVMQWRYHPTTLNGEPMEVETRITVIFTMDRQ